MNKKRFVGVILAAGFSSRAKTFKMTLEFGNSTVIENTILKMSKYCSKVIVVGGYKIENLKYLQEKYSFVDLIFNQDYEEGMYSSVLKGFNYALTLGDWDRVIFTPGDYPAVKQEVYEELTSIAQDNKASCIVIPVFKEHDYYRNGHPIIIEKKLLESNNLNDYSNLREFLSNRKQTYVIVEDSAILKDLDTIEDYKALLEMRGAV